MKQPFVRSIEESFTTTDYTECLAKDRRQSQRSGSQGASSLFAVCDMNDSICLSRGRRAGKKERTISPAKSMTKRQALQVSLKIGYLAYDALQVTDDI
jgi:hypothetical protein